MARVMQGSVFNTHPGRHILEREGGEQRAHGDICVDRKIRVEVAVGKAETGATAKSFWAQFEVSIDRREDLGAITKFLHLRSCLSGAALKAIEGITVCAENYPEVVQTLHNRFHRVPEVVESHVLKVVSLKECSDDGAADLTRLLDDLNRHFLELRALGKDVDANLSGFHALLPIIKKKLPPDTLEAWRAFVL
ncbi:conserved hypothetical protein [Trichinella spiralis]|uniref:hypothetical protein n=1 Tax=Trichinella spiralis TaxID=6334 RepID=UPI0001EFD8E5|nr:conserved hypothetical protein [Trichinella spiralis]